MVIKLGISQPKQYLQENFPAVLALDTAVVHSSILDQVDAALEEAMVAGEWFVLLLCKYKNCK